MTYEELVAYMKTLEQVPCPDAESFTDLDHALQCALILWKERPDDDELVIAGLVHDIGHRLGSDEDHGTVGAEVVRPLLGDRIADLVAAHVPAKRYLVATDPSYASVLSPLSTISLRRQGGTANAEEMAAWEHLPVFADALVLRRADDQAKAPGRAVPSLEQWLPLVASQVARVCDCPSWRE
jgi:predicted HD phosphohydrolase